MRSWYHLFILAAALTTGSLLLAQEEENTDTPSTEEQEEIQANYTPYSGATFTVDVPEGWTMNENLPNGTALEVASADSVFNWRIIVQPTKNKKAKQILETMEKQLKYKNYLEPKSRVVGKPILSSMTAKEGYVGAYTVEKNGQSIDQRIWVLVKGKNAYIIVETVLEDHLTRYVDVKDHMSKSLKIN